VEPERLCLEHRARDYAEAPEAPDAADATRIDVRRTDDRGLDDADPRGSGPMLLGRARAPRAKAKSDPRISIRGSIRFVGSGENGVGGHRDLGDPGPVASNPIQEPEIHPKFET
jgi:hypothetical protein